MIKKLKRYAGYYNYSISAKNPSFTNLTIGKKNKHEEEKVNKLQTIEKYFEILILFKG